MYYERYTHMMAPNKNGIQQKNHFIMSFGNNDTLQK